MGCCMSKFSPKTKGLKQVEESQEKCCYGPEKMFMSRCPSRVSPLLPHDKNRFIPIPIPIPDKFIHIPDKLPPPPSLSPIKPQTTSNTSLISSSSSSLSTSSSSISVSKEISFSNDFLRACYQENSHVSRINSLREYSLSMKLTKPAYPSRFNSPVRYSTTPKEDPKKGTNGSKRNREPSPNNIALIRQKSFRKDQERVIISSSNSLTKGKFLKSPSPSKRFGMERADLTVSSVSCCKRKESLDMSNIKTCPKNNISESRVNLISSKMDERVIKEESVNHKEPVVPIFEEIANPLIDLNCFIFL